VYRRGAGRKRLVGATMHLLGTEGGQESLTFNQQQPNQRLIGSSLNYDEDM